MNLLNYTANANISLIRFANTNEILKRLQGTNINFVFEMEHSLHFISISDAIVIIFYFVFPSFRLLKNRAFLKFIQSQNKSPVKSSSRFYRFLVFERVQVCFCFFDFVESFTFHLHWLIVFSQISDLIGDSFKTFLC